MSTKNIHKLKSKHYTQIIETITNIRFYWAGDGFDGIELGPLDNPTRYELRLIHQVLQEIATGIQSRHIVDYIKTNHKGFLRLLISELEQENGIPKAFLHAFRENEHEQ